MLKPFGGFNSKGFLLAYLVIVMIILAMWAFRVDKAEPEYRTLPASLRSYLVSPAKSLPQILLQNEKEQNFTNTSLSGNWTWLYFTHPQCLPDCATVFTVLRNLQQNYAASNTDFLLVNFDDSAALSMLEPLHDLKIALPQYTANPNVLESLTDALDFLYLKTPREKSGYQIEQYHYIYLIDPKGRWYATFKPPYTSAELQRVFIMLRTFYARSE